MNIVRFFSGLSIRLQCLTIFLSVVGIFFGVKTFFDVRLVFGEAESILFLHHLWAQIAIAAILNVVVGVIIFRIATNPIKILSEVMRSITLGKLDVEVPYVKVPSEIGSMARKVEILRKLSIDKVRLEQEQKINKEQSEKNQKEAKISLAKEFENNISGIINHVHESISDLNAIAEKLAHNTSNVSKSTQVTKQSTESSNNSVQTISKSTEQLSLSVREISSQVMNSTKAVEMAVTNMENADKEANVLATVSEEVGTVVEVIREIAEQINLLALNATIESARAGEAGRGFAVVANEVKNLANQTGKATEDIANKIEGLQAASTKVIKAIQLTRDSISNVNTYSNGISSAVEEQNSVTAEISENMKNTTKVTEEALNSINTIYAESNNASESASVVLTTSKALSLESENLKKQVDHFIAEIKN